MPTTQNPFDHYLNSCLCAQCATGDPLCCFQQKGQEMKATTAGRVQVKQQSREARRMHKAVFSQMLFFHSQKLLAQTTVYWDENEHLMVLKSPILKMKALSLSHPLLLQVSCLHNSPVCHFFIICQLSAFFNVLLRLCHKMLLL